MIRFPSDQGNYFGHFFAYAIAFLLLSVWGRWRVLSLSLSLTSLGILIEIFQPYFGRAGHWEDALANAGGVTVSLVIVSVWRRLKDYA